MPSGYMPREEFTLFYNAYFDRVRYAAAVILGDERDSLAIADIAMFYAFCHPDKFRRMTPVAVEAYLLNIARTRSYDELRCRARNCHTDISKIENTPYAASDESVERLVEIKDIRDAVERCIRAMPDIYRDTLTLKIAKGLTLVEVAAALDIPINTAKTRLRRGMLLLGGFIRARGYTVP